MYISSRNHKLKTYCQTVEESGYLVLLLMWENDVKFRKLEKYMLRYYTRHDNCMRSPSLFFLFLLFLATVNNLYTTKYTYIVDSLAHLNSK